MDPNNLSMEQFEALSPDQQRTLLDGGDLPALEPEAPAPTPEPTPTPDPVTEPPTVPAPEAAPEATKKGDPDVPLRAARAKVRDYEAILQDPNALAQLLAQQGFQVMPVQAQEPAEAPDLFVDPQAAITHHVNAAIAPLMGHIQNQNAFIQGLQQQQRMNELRQTYGDDAADHIAHFDATAPHMKDLDPELKLLAVRGARSVTADPAATQAQVEAKAKEMAEKIVAEKLAGMSPQAGVKTLGGATPALANDVPVDINAMSEADFAKLTPAQIKALGQNLHG